MNMDMVVMLVTVTAALFLAVRGFRSQGANFNRTVTMAAIWVAIIAALAFVLQRYAV